MAAKPNILLISADQWRGDCLGIAGHSVVRTPHADALAREGRPVCAALCRIGALRPGARRSLHRSFIK